MKEKNNNIGIESFYLLNIWWNLDEMIDMCPYKFE